MTPEIWTIIGVGIALAAVILNGQRAARADRAELRGEIQGLRQELGILREDFGKLRERMAHLEGLLEGLREAITRNRAA